MIEAKKPKEFVIGRVAIKWECPHCGERQYDEGEGCTELECVICREVSLVVDGRMLCRCPHCTPAAKVAK